MNFARNIFKSMSSINTKIDRMLQHGPSVEVGDKLVKEDVYENFCDERDPVVMIFLSNLLSKGAPAKEEIEALFGMLRHARLARYDTLKELSHLAVGIGDSFLLLEEEMKKPQPDIEVILINKDAIVRGKTRSEHLVRTGLVDGYRSFAQEMEQIVSLSRSIPPVFVVELKAQIYKLKRELKAMGKGFVRSLLVFMGISLSIIERRKTVALCMGQCALVIAHYKVHVRNVIALLDYDSEEVRRIESIYNEVAKERYELTQDEMLCVKSSTDRDVNNFILVSAESPEVECAISKALHTDEIQTYL